MILIIGTPKKEPLILGNPQIRNLKPRAVMMYWANTSQRCCPGFSQWTSWFKFCIREDDAWRFHVRVDTSRCVDCGPKEWRAAHGPHENSAGLPFGVCVGCRSVCYSVPACFSTLTRVRTRFDQGHCGRSSETLRSATCILYILHEHRNLLGNFSFFPNNSQWESYHPFNPLWIPSPLPAREAAVWATHQPLNLKP